MGISSHELSSMLAINFIRYGLTALVAGVVWLTPGMHRPVQAAEERTLADIERELAELKEYAAANNIDLGLGDDLFSEVNFSDVGERVSMDYPFLNKTLAKSSDGFNYTTAIDDGALATIHSNYYQVRSSYRQKLDGDLAKRIRNVDFQIAHDPQLKGLWNITVAFDLTEEFSARKKKRILLDGAIGASCDTNDCSIELAQVLDSASADQVKASDRFSGSLVCLSLPAGRATRLSEACSQALVNINQQDKRGIVHSAYTIVRNLPKSVEFLRLRAASEATTPESPYTAISSAIDKALDKKQRFQPGAIRGIRYSTYEVYRGVSGFYFRFEIADQEFVFDGPLVSTEGQDLKSRLVRLMRKTRPLQTASQLPDLYGYLEDKVALPFLLENDGKGTVTLVLAVARKFPKGDDHDEEAATNEIRALPERKARRQVVDLLGEEASRKFDFIALKVSAQQRDLRLDRIKEVMDGLLD